MGNARSGFRSWLDIHAFCVGFFGACKQLAHFAAPVTRLAMSATPLLILYGSATGNAQDVAERVFREAKAMAFAPRLLPMDAYDLSELPKESLAVFVVATAGQVGGSTMRACIALRDVCTTCECQYTCVSTGNISGQR